MTSNFIDASQTLVLDSMPDKQYLLDVYAGINPQLKQTALFMIGTGNGFGGLGIGASDTSSTPVQTSAGGTNWKQISNNTNHTAAAIKSDGTLWTWGYNNQGVLGVGSILDKSTPVQVGALTTWKSVSVGEGYFAAAIRTDGTLWTWGDNTSGQLGIGSVVAKSSPNQVSGTNWKSVVATSSRTWALKNDGTIWWWGGGSSSSPVQFATSIVTTWKQVSASITHSASLDTSGNLYMQGFNNYGQLGDGTLTNQTSFTSAIPIQSDLTWKVVKCGPYSTAGIKSDGTLWVWGANKSVPGMDASYTLGVGDNVSRSSPTQIAGGGSWIDVSEPNVYGTFAIKSDGTIWTWGYNFYRCMDQGSAQLRFSTPVQIISGDNSWKQVSSGGSKASFLKEVGDLG